jgi:hypothetical protein
MSSHVRRSHLKSRTGCQQCKRRRIKCDEVAGCCGQCRKTRIACSFSETSSQPASTNVLDLELLYNFVVRTGKTLSDHEQMQECIATSLVEVGLQHDFLLHAILALSAFHLQQTSKGPSSPDQYILAAHTHHTRALQKFSQSIKRIDSKSCHGLFGCAFLLFTTSLARPRGDDTSSTARYSEWMNLIRGIPVILYEADTIGWLSSGPLAALFQVYADISSPPIDESLKVNAMQNINRLTTTIIETSVTSITTTCREPLLTLRNSFENLRQIEGARVAFSWVARLSRDYMALLDEKCPEALLILAHYCVLLHTLDHRWWIKGWPKYMLACIRPMLGEKWLVCRYREIPIISYASFFLECS